jgi:hypothetical protein
MPNNPLSPELLFKTDSYWRAANYLSAGQIYLYDNPLLKRPLTLADIKHMLPGDVRPIAASGKDAFDRVQSLCGRAASKARCNHTGAVQLLRLHSHLWSKSERRVPASADNSIRPISSPSEGHQRGVAATNARADSRTGTMARPSGARRLCVPRGSHQ